MHISLTLIRHTNHHIKGNQSHLYKVNYKNKIYKWVPTNTFKSFGRRNNPLSCNSFREWELGNTDKWPQSTDVLSQVELKEPEDLDTRPSRDSLSTESRSEEVTEKDLLQKELFVENLSLLELLGLRTLRIISQLLRRKSEESCQD